MLLFDDNLDNVSLESTPSSDKENTKCQLVYKSLILNDNLGQFDCRIDEWAKRMRQIVRTKWDKNYRQFKETSFYATKQQSDVFLKIHARARVSFTDLLLWCFDA